MATTGMRDLSVQTFLLDNLIIPRDVNVWSGLSDYIEEGLWIWQDGVLATAFNTNWAAGEPDNREGNSNCAYLDFWDKMMHDGWCFRNLTRALCEREKVDL